MSVRVPFCTKAMDCGKLCEQASVPAKMPRSLMPVKLFPNGAIIIQEISVMDCPANRKAVGYIRLPPWNAPTISPVLLILRAVLERAATGVNGRAPISSVAGLMGLWGAVRNACGE